jgi:hypothetical protein
MRARASSSMSPWVLLGWQAGAHSQRVPLSLGPQARAADRAVAPPPTLGLTLLVHALVALPAEADRPRPVRREGPPPLRACRGEEGGHADPQSGGAQAAANGGLACKGEAARRTLADGRCQGQGRSPATSRPSCTAPVDTPGAASSSGAAVSFSARPWMAPPGALPGQAKGADESGAHGKSAWPPPRPAPPLRPLGPPRRTVCS